MPTVALTANIYIGFPIYIVKKHFFLNTTPIILQNLP